MKGTVYKYTFSDGKVYIGKTRHAQKRILDHFDKNSGPSNPLFYDAYIRLGEPKYEVLFEDEFYSLIDFELAISHIEVYYINLYDATNPDNGYNVRAHSALSANTIRPLEKRISELTEELLKERLATYNSAHKKINRTKEPLTKEELFLVKEKYRDRNIFQFAIDDFNFMDIRKNSYSKREFLLDDALPSIERIICFDTENEVREYVYRNADEIIKEVNYDKIILKIDRQGEVVGEYNSINDICEELNIVRADNIRNVLRGKQKTAYGFIWRYKKDFEKEIK